MSFAATSQAFAILTLLGLVTALGAVALGVFGKKELIVREFGRLLPTLVFVVSLGATLGSLYYSEVVGFEPCRLCWYQRIAMYPLALLSGAALLRRDRTIFWYIRLQAGIGALISAYHYLIQSVTSLDAGGACSATVPCTLKYVNQFGFVSIPFMAFSSFALIVVASHFALKPKETPDE